MSSNRNARGDAPRPLFKPITIREFCSLPNEVRLIFIRLLWCMYGITCSVLAAN